MEINLLLYKGKPQFASNKESFIIEYINSMTTKYTKFKKTEFDIIKILYYKK